MHQYSKALEMAMNQNALTRQVNGEQEELLIAPRDVPYATLKRALDIVGSLILLTLLLPFYIICILAIKTTSPGPVLYSCRRVGLGGRTFKFVKFRSMYTDADKRLSPLLEKNEKDGPIFKMECDPRVTPIGRFLRKYSLDELPQIIHVLTGHMSLVGPRPPLPREVALYNQYALERLSVKPGLTCYWQICGRSRLSFDEWMQLDHKYMEEMNLWTDLKIIAKTPVSVLKGDGAY